ncbi:MAG: hypothetical protein LBG21_04740 [Campylobacteraceae bacterium]|jgi:hypothetical protein|nr:hypothetical protein [Campylobacteraceae bacterium]
MDNKRTLLLEIASLIEVDANSSMFDLSIMEYMSFEELTSIRDGLQKRKNNRKEEQNRWYDEWVEKCGI